MTRAELSMHDGRDGRKAYIAVNGTIYDVTGSPRWANGLHPPDHQAGQDLTEELKAAPHVRAVVERFPVVGKLEEDPPETAGGSGGSGKLVVAVIVVVVVVVLAVLLLR